MGQRALVLGAGGHAATAWELGVITGMADVGVDVRDADLIVGTSAGARVGVQVRSHLTLEELFQRQVDPHLQTKEPAPPVDFTHGVPISCEPDRAQGMPRPCSGVSVRLPWRRGWVLKTLGGT